MTGGAHLITATLDNRLKSIEKDIKIIQENIKNLQHLYGSCLSSSQLRLSEENIKSLIRDNSTLITNIQEKLKTVMIPEETRYYLKESEVTDFRSNFQKLLVMMSDIDDLYKNIVAHVTNL